MYQRRRLAAAVHFILAVLLWLLGYGWIVHLYSAVEAVMQRADGESCNA